MKNQKQKQLSNSINKGANKHYMQENELTMEEVFHRVAFAYKKAPHDLCVRLKQYMMNGWFCPATPILANLGTHRGLPISCFLNEPLDDKKNIIKKGIYETSSMMSIGGGVGTNWSNVRGIGESISNGGQTGGIIPFIKAQEGLAMAISQGGSLRRGNIAVYLHISHPEIEEFINLRRDGKNADFNRRCLSIHHAIIIPDSFMVAVQFDAIWDLTSPKTKQIVKSIKARKLWNDILITRLETGEPYILFIDNANNNRCVSYKKNKLDITMSNLCSEVLLNTSTDYNKKQRSAVCCLASLNLEHFDEYKNNYQFFKDIMIFLDNVLTIFINQRIGYSAELKDAIYSAKMERSVGLGVMGFASHLQKKNLAWSEPEAHTENEFIFKVIKRHVDQASNELATERGANPDCKRAGLLERFSNKTAIAPTSSISLVVGTSPSIEPYIANAYNVKNNQGTNLIKNKNLEELLYKKKQNNDDIWLSIISNQGSVQHLDFLSHKEKEIYKTAYEINQMDVINMASARTPYIDQSQSLNIFLSPTIEKSHLATLHFHAWKKGIKSLYYCRSQALKKINTPLTCNISDQSCLACE